MIIRKPYSEDRLFEIIATMPKPGVSYKFAHTGTPTIYVEAINEGGICLYKYEHSGTIGANKLLARLEGL